MRSELRFTFWVVFSGYLYLLRWQPFQFPGDDLNLLIWVRSRSWGYLLRELFSFQPLYAHGFEGWHSTRIFEAIVFKLLGYFNHPMPFTVLKCMSIAAVCTFGHWLSKNKLTPLLIAAFPGTMASVMWIADFSAVAWALACISIYFLFKNKPFIFLLFAFLATRTNEAAKILPLLSMPFFFKKEYFTGKIRLGFPIAIILLGISVLPFRSIEVDKKTDKIMIFEESNVRTIAEKITSYLIPRSLD